MADRKMFQPFCSMAVSFIDILETKKNMEIWQVCHKQCANKRMGKLKRNSVINNFQRTPLLLMCNSHMRKLLEGEEEMRANLVQRCP
jgi:hypothetical protein